MQALKWVACGIMCLGAVMHGRADESGSSPWATGGQVTRIDLGNCRAAYIHTFTDTADAATFTNISDRTLSIRYLVVGAGGAGGVRYANSTIGGGGGGGGGVCERRDVAFANGAAWQIRVGKGAATYTDTAGTSTISNNLTEIVAVPGGGNGAAGNKQAATEGAAGGGGNGVQNFKTGANGVYPSSLFGVEYGPFKGADVAGARNGAGGGGAGAAGNGATGGTGLPSDITGESLVYGSGGGGGCGKNPGDGNKHYQGGCGGSRAGNGGLYDASSNVVVATSAEANSGGGGGGSAGWDKLTAGEGADGIVIIRYEVAESPCEGGDTVTRTELRPGKYRYLHTFTNATQAAAFVNRSGRDLNVRYLVVGAGGSGSLRYATNQQSGAGGGGGGVCEKSGVSFTNGTGWTVVVGKGASSIDETAGASSISNGVAEVELVPGGGNAGKSGSSPIPPTVGAAGGGGVNNSPAGAAGNYPSSILGQSAGGPYSGGDHSGRAAGGGGGAGGAGATDESTSRHNGGIGLVSEITGEPLMFGAGGGGGGCAPASGASINGGLGGMGDARAANGGGWTTEVIDGVETRVYYSATKPAANSGNGGAGARYGGDQDTFTGGADGIVVIRYDYSEVPQGLILIFR